ncbi:hypothetical protein IG631_11546 [Alternaria alternata]|nr:hypothetical protein IG631_11546 [Alternaria alternata]
MERAESAERRHLLRQTSARKKWDEYAEGGYARLWMILRGFAQGCVLAVWRGGFLEGMPERKMGLKTRRSGGVVCMIVRCSLAIRGTGRGRLTNDKADRKTMDADRLKQIPERSHNVRIIFPEGLEQCMKAGKMQSK